MNKTEKLSELRALHEKYDRKYNKQMKKIINLIVRIEEIESSIKEMEE